MSVLAALTTLLLFSGSAIAQIDTAKCTLSSWNWVRNSRNVSDPTCFWQLTSYVQTFNSLNQDPCKVAGYLQSTCNGGCEYSSWLCRRYRLISCSLYNSTPPVGIQVHGPEQSWWFKLVQVYYHCVF